jgi:hypothetical protein
MVDTASNDRITVDLQIKTQKYAIAITLSVTKQNKLLSYSIQKKKKGDHDADCKSWALSPAACIDSCKPPPVDPVARASNPKPEIVKRNVHLNPGNLLFAYSQFL